MPGKEFKRMILILLNNKESKHEIKKSIHDRNEKFCWDIDLFKRNQSEILEMKNLICQIESTVESLNNRLGEAEGSISKLEEKYLEIDKKI